jgi:short-subunit dehydrogenase
MPGPLSSRHRNAFVTGASTGLGRAFVEMLLADGVRVWGTSRDKGRLASLVSVHGERFGPVAMDLRDAPAALASFAEADRASGGIDLLVNNAGFGAFGGFADVDFAVWRDQLNVMLVATAELAHAALRTMVPRGGGAIVNVSSLAAEFPLPYQAAYNIAKAGLSALSESLMLETEGTGVAIIDLRPGDFRTDFGTSVTHAPGGRTDRQKRAWEAFARMMRQGPPPREAAEALRRALLRGRGGTVRCGRFFQARVAPFLARLGTLALKRRVQARYFDVS